MPLTSNHTKGIAALVNRHNYNKDKVMHVTHLRDDGAPIIASLENTCANKHMAYPIRAPIPNDENAIPTAPSYHIPF
jgi:hypothetical protein